MDAGITARAGSSDRVVCVLFDPRVVGMRAAAAHENSHSQEILLTWLAQRDGAGTRDDDAAGRSIQWTTVKAQRRHTIMMMACFIPPAVRALVKAGISSSKHWPHPSAMRRRKLLPPPPPALLHWASSQPPSTSFTRSRRPSAHDRTERRMLGRAPLRKQETREREERRGGEGTETKCWWRQGGDAVQELVGGCGSKKLQGALTRCHSRSGSYRALSTPSNTAQ